MECSATVAPELVIMMEVVIVVMGEAADLGVHGDLVGLPLLGGLVRLLLGLEHVALLLGLDGLDPAARGFVTSCL